MKKVVFIFIILFLGQSLSSCAIYGVTSDYGKLNDTDKSRVKEFDGFENLENDFIYPINADQLKQEIKNYPKALVYVFTNGCSSPYCLPMASYQKFAAKNDTKLFLVMTGYANINTTLNQHAATPYFSIDHNYYNKKIRGVYFRYFMNEMMGLPREGKIKEYSGNLLFYENGEFKEARRELPDS